MGGKGVTFWRITNAKNIILQKKKHPKIPRCYLVHKLAFMTHQTLTFNTFEAAFLKGCYVVNAVVERVNSFV